MKLDVLAIGSHPDDVELGCGATLALLVERGYRAGILHLTRGELGTRGTTEQRNEEALAAARALGIELEPIYLDCGDGGLRAGREEEDALIEVLRRYRPEMILGPTPRDRHPDHSRAHALVADAAFYAGLARRAPAAGAIPFRAKAVYSYMQHDLFESSFVVDVSTTWERKMAALRCYGSQLHRPTEDDALEQRSTAPPTKVSSPEFWQAVTGRGQHFGQVIGAAYGEPFWSSRPLPITDPMMLRPSGLP